jgi:penicillin-binding protein 2
MSRPKIPRRTFLKSLGSLLLLSGCSSELVTGKPTATPLPSPTPTPLPRADAVAQAYLDAWGTGNYGAMYQLLTPDSQFRLSQDQFERYYTVALNEATAKTVETQLQSLLHTGQEATVTFHTNWHTYLFGDIAAANQMNLLFSEGRWGVAWRPTLVLPQLGEGVNLVFLGEQPTRGNIYDSKVHALATQGPMVTVGVIPQYLQDQEGVIGHLSAIAKFDPEKARKNIAAARPDWFVPVVDISFETSLEYDNLLNNLAGVQRRTREVRTYNDGKTAAHLIGYMGSIPPDRKETYLEKGYQGDELVGLAGVEEWAEEALAGHHGGRLVTLSANNQVLSEIATAPSEAGQSVYLTIDTTFQATVEKLLGEQLGAIVVMEPNNGLIYAMASYPRFKPTVFTTGFNIEEWMAFYTNEQRPLLNRATQGLYPPGSVFKIISLSAGLEGLGLKPAQTYYCNGRWSGLGAGYEKRCWLASGHGEISLIDGLTQSCDVVFYEVGLALHKHSPELLPQWARTFGLGQATGIAGVRESVGIVPDEAWKQATYNQPLFDGDAVNSAIGQGYMLVTPLQIARLMAAVANGGQLLHPRLIDRIVSVDGVEQPYQPPVAERLPLAPENLALLRRSLEAVVSGVRGTARGAFLDIEYTVAGKTGTAESGQEEPHAWFVGYAPTDAPRVAITVVLEHAGEGSAKAAPLFRQVLEAFWEWEANQI